MAIEPNFQVDGLLIDQTISISGHRFYDELVSNVDINELNGTITIAEQLNPLGNSVSIEVYDELIFKDFINSRGTGVDEKAALAANQLKAYLQALKNH